MWYELTVIENGRTLYLKFIGTGRNRLTDWVEDKKDAHKFKTKKTAERYLRNVDPMYKPLILTFTTY